jgi:hypothetical protein
MGCGTVNVVRDQDEEDGVLRNTMLRVSLAMIMMIGVATACSKEQRQEIVDDTVEVAARNVASEGGALEFAKSDIDVDGDLDCTANAESGAQTLAVTCTGTSTEGQSLTMDGQLTIADGEIVDSSGFVGKADGDEVFTVDCVGEACNLGS